MPVINVFWASSMHGMENEFVFPYVNASPNNSNITVISIS